MAGIRVRYATLAVILFFVFLHVFRRYYINSVDLQIRDRHFPLLYDKEDSRGKYPHRLPLTCKARKPVQDADIKISQVYEELKFDNLDSPKWRQGWEVTYDIDQWKNRSLEVVVLPHSHQDPGWVQTFNEYLAHKTKPCLDSTLDFLDKNKQGRFIYAEVSFLEGWWSGLTVSERTAFTRLVRDGQWEIATGGWVMNDEAASHYAATATQLTEGQHWLMDNLGYYPNVSWAIDPFGHSTSEAYLLRKAGFEHILIQRTHYEIKKKFASQKTLEFRWRQPWDSSGSTEVLCHMMPFYSYDAPHSCGPDPAVCCQFDFARLKNYRCPWGQQPVPITNDNVASRAELLADQYRKKATLYNNGDVVFVPLGDDFRYLSKDEWEAQFNNYKLLMDYINSKPEMRMHVQFGTLSTYFNLVKSRKPASSFPSLVGDLFTYADRNHDYWSGYFTSRPSHKALSRVLEAELRSAEILFSLARHQLPHKGSKLDLQTFRHLYDLISSARRNLSLFQHHDGVTGTAQVYVMQDYRQRLISALQNSQTVAGASLSLLLGFGNSLVEQAVRTQLRESDLVLLHSADWDWSVTGTPSAPIINFLDLDQVQHLVLFNNHAQKRDHIVRLDLDLGQVLRLVLTKKRLLTVKLSYDNVGSSQVPLHQLEPSPRQIYSASGRPQERTSSLFRLRAGPITLLPLQILRLSLRLETTGSNEPSLEVLKPVLFNIAPGRIAYPYLYDKALSNPLSSGLESPHMRLFFNPQTGFIMSIMNPITGISHPLSISFNVYKSKSGESSSGAYLFLPELPSVPLPLSSEPNVRVVTGALVDEVTTYHPNLVHTVRTYKTGEPGRLAIEVENILNLTHPHNNDEVVMTISTGIKNFNRVFYTDSNCLQFTRRVFYEKIPLQGNVYPVTCAAYIEDDRYRVTLLSAQSLGFLAGERPGQMNICLDRRLSQDDNRGMGEPVLDNVPTRSVFRIVVETLSSGSPPVPSGSSELPLPGLTQEAQWILNDLIYPTSQFLFSPTTDADLIGQFKTDLLLMRPEGLPSDYELVALKTFFSTSERFLPDMHSTPGSQLGILLHRTLPFCGRTDLCEHCNTTSSSGPDQVEVSGLFPLLSLQRALRTSLTFIPKKPQQEGWQAPTTSLTVQPMELEAFLLLPAQQSHR
ncbi:Alpha-mannosidase 2 [Sparganum proliferum]